MQEREIAHGEEEAAAKKARTDETIVAALRG
jgi:hypothetical protein